MLDHARRVAEAVAGRRRDELETDLLLAAALERFIEVIGEAATKVSATTRDSAKAVPWRQMIGMRNRLVHGYAAVDHDIVWDVATVDIPSLIVSLEQLLDT